VTNETVIEQDIDGLSTAAGRSVWLAFVRDGGQFTGLVVGLMGVRDDNG